MGKRQPSAQEWFEKGDQFYFTALHLMSPDKKDLQPIFAIPHITLKAFASEAYFKCLIALECAGFPPRKHDLEKLFDGLHPASRKRIRELWTAECAPKLRVLASQPGKPPDIKVLTSLRGVLRQSAEAFIEFRYRAQGDTAAFTIMSLPLLVRQRILEVRPDFAPPNGHPLAWLNPQQEFVEPKDENLGK